MHELRLLANRWMTRSDTVTVTSAECIPSMVECLKSSRLSKSGQTQSRGRIALCLLTPLPVQCHGYRLQAFLLYGDNSNRSV
jgi:hypothetical protein